jgi:hypothetical protein
MNSTIWSLLTDKLAEVWNKRSPGLLLTLFADNLGFHRNVGPILKLKEQFIVFFFLPPNTSHFLQPLDNLMFAILKSQIGILATHLKNALETLGLPEGDSMILITAVLSSAEAMAFAPEKIILSFSNVGAWPFNAEKIKRLAEINVGIKASEEDLDDPSVHPPIKISLLIFLVIDGNLFRI